MRTLFDECENTERPQTTAATLKILKEADQDFEWYPTTSAMIAAVFKNCGRPHSILDIGAGDGRVLKSLYDLSARADRCKPNLYAIEKAEFHIQNMPDKIAIVGTDFLMQSLIDKSVDMIFCNPPYSKFEEWAAKIILEASAKTIFLILPDRWKTSGTIGQALKARELNARTIWTGDFTDAERQARAKVEIIEINLVDHRAWGRDTLKSDPFDVWFDSVFPEFDRIKPEDHSETTSEKKKAKFAELTKGQNLIERLHEMYIADMNRLHDNYRSLCAIDPDLLRELGVKHEELKEGLKLKIKGTKNLYWNELFDRLDKITKRLTNGSRRDIVEKMQSCCNVDFTADNAYAVVIWVIKNANLYINSQLCDLFRSLSEPESIKNYKSNQRTWQKQCWRYRAEDHSHYVLDYRIVSQNHSAIYNGDGYGKYDYPDGLHKGSHAFLQDIMTVANNLGFANSDSTYSRTWESNSNQDFYLDNSILLMSVRAFKNGNIHLKFNIDFIKTLNIEAARLLGWVRSPEQAADEMGYDLEFIKNRYKSNLIFAPADCKLLTA